MHAWESIQKTLDYIEDHISEEHSIEELAKIAALSPFYYQRLFTRLVKKPVKEYIKYRRLARASQPLKDKERRILDIALEYGFQSHETFTRAFKAAYGLTPEQYRSDPVMLNQFDKPDLLLNYTMVDEGVPLITGGLVLEMNRRVLTEPVTFAGITGFIPIEGQIPLGEGTGEDLPGKVWEQFHKEKHRLPRIPGGRELGVAFFGDAPAGSFTYFAGAEAASSEDCKGLEAFEIWKLPPREYIVCGFEAENFQELVTVTINKAIKFCGLWLEKHGYTQQLYSPEMYYDSTPDEAYMEIWIPYEINPSENK